MATNEDGGAFRIGGELAVNRLGFGAMRITGAGVWGPPPDRDECMRVLRRAVELNVNFIDTAEAYGPAVSEDLIREALYPYPEGLVIATKGGYDRPGPDRWVTNGRPDRLRQELEGSLRRLRVDRIDLWQLHRIDPNVSAEDQLGTLADFRREGKVRFVGLSEVTVEQIQHAREHVPIVSVQNRYNLEDREWEPVLDYCTGEGVAFIPWFPLQVGKLAEGGGTLGRIARAHEATPAQIAIAWLLHHSPVMLPIPGTSKVQHLEQNVSAASIELSEDEVRELGSG